MVCIAYAGCEIFDVVLYIGRTITKLQHRILIVDLSETGAMEKAIKHGMGLDSSNGIVNYRDINYTRKVPSEQELEAFQTGVVFVIYGIKKIEEFPFPYKNINLVVNNFPHEIAKVDALMCSEINNHNKIRLLIRDIVSLDDIDIVKRLLSLSDMVEKVDYLYLDFDDNQSAVECQLKQVVRFKKISMRMKKYILEQVSDIFPKLKPRKIRKAMMSARRGV